MFEGIEIDLLDKDEYTTVVKKFGDTCVQTDFAVATGAFVASTIGKIKKNSADVLTKTFYQEEDYFYDRVVIYDNYKKAHIIKEIRTWTAAIRPVLNLSPEVFKEITKNKITLNDGKEAVLFGEYVQDGVGILGTKLKSLEKKGKLNKLEETYTFNTYEDTVHGCDDLELKTVPVYEYAGRKFIKAKVNYCDSNDYYLIRKVEHGFLKNGDETWFEIKPVVWLIDYENNRLIAKNALVSGIPFHNENRLFNYEESFINNFLNNCMLHDILQSVSNMKKKKNNEIDDILDEIIQYKKYYLGKEDIAQKISILIDTYNSDVKRLSKEENPSGLNIGYKDVNQLYGELVENLNSILDTLKSDYEKAKPCNDMIDTLNGLVENDLSKFIGCIRTVINNEILKDDKEALTTRLDNIIQNQIENCKVQIELLKEGNEIKSAMDLEVDFRRDIHPFLDSLNNIIEKKDIVHEIMTGIKNIINDQYTESNNMRVKYLLEVINEVRKKIKTCGNSKDRAELDKLLKYNIDYSKDILSILKELSEIVKKAYVIELKINERINKRRFYANSIVEVDLGPLYENEESNQMNRG